MDNYESNRVLAANYASGRYHHCKDEIDHIKRQIYNNRKGTLPLTSIQHNAERLEKRVEREGLPLEQAIERINGVPNFQDVYIVEKILRLSKTVCRVNVASQSGVTGYGTGFLIASNLIITNNHVLPTSDSAINSFVQFNYQLSEDKVAQSVISFRLRPNEFYMTSTLEKDPNDPNSGLDFTIVAVADVSDEGISITQIKPSRLDEGLGKIIEGENCVVIQHPAGDYKKIVLKDIRMITLVDDFLVYESDTLPGSSGSVVVGLGTGEIVALHHSGVPRRNEAGDWLRKDGKPVQPGDDDDAIDWIGNEGIRVSSIIRAIRNLPLPKKMENIRQALLDHAKTETTTSSSNNNGTPKPNIMTPQSGKDTTATAPPAKQASLYFEVELVDDESFLTDWNTNAPGLIKGLQSKERLFPYSTLPHQRNLYYISVQSDSDPWELAASIETLPHVLSCTPDLPVQTDIGLSMQKPETALTESAITDKVYDDGTAVWNEEKFLKEWSNSECFKKSAGYTADYYRQWNWVAVNYPKLDEVKNWDQLKNNLNKLKLVQLDTGYSDHSKLKNAYNFSLDMDFIDSDLDARDSKSGFGLRQPNHGTRTASLVVGGKMSAGAFAYDGNRGLLTEQDTPLIKLIPYRVSKSVILIGRGKDMVDAAQHAVNNNADVMFMCMGTYPRPMIEEMVRYAYDKGVIWVCAAGNEVEIVIAPALYPGTIAVAAINPAYKPWKGSSNGDTVDIAAPGESVYVPFWDKDGNEIMCYGDGTSYATPHVASAAFLWKARNLDQLSKYTEPWMVVEAFRTCLKQSAYVPDGWSAGKYGQGILDVKKLLEAPLPEPQSLTHAYKGKAERKTDDLGVRETVHFLWNTLKRKLTPGVTESLSGGGLSPRARTALRAIAPKKPSVVTTESIGVLATESQKKQILSEYFDNHK